MGSDNLLPAAVGLEPPIRARGLALKEYFANAGTSGQDYGWRLPVGAIRFVNIGYRTRGGRSKRVMKIGELARSTGVSIKAIRFYEEQGVMPPAPRTDAGYRVYAQPDVDRLEFIRKAKRLGMSLDEIRGVLQLHDVRQPTCVHVRALLDDKIAGIDATLRELRSFRAELSGLRDSSGDMEDCCPTGGNVCGIVERSEVRLGEASGAWIGSHWPRSR